MTALGWMSNGHRGAIVVFPRPTSAHQIHGVPWQFGWRLLSLVIYTVHAADEQGTVSLLFLMLFSRAGGLGLIWWTGTGQGNAGRHGRHNKHGLCVTQWQSVSPKREVLSPGEVRWYEAMRWSDGRSSSGGSGPRPREVSR